MRTRSRSKPNHSAVRGAHKDARLRRPVREKPIEHRAGRARSPPSWIRAYTGAWSLTGGRSQTRCPLRFRGNPTTSQG